MTPLKAGDASRHQPSITSLRATISALPRRVNHGGAAWLRRRGEELRQPQDGALHEPATTAKAADRSTRSVEGDDAMMTGGTRSLMRRLMGLNIAATAAAQVRTAAGVRKLLPRPVISV